MLKRRTDTVHNRCPGEGSGTRHPGVSNTGKADMPMESGAGVQEK